MRATDRSDVPFGVTRRGGTPPRSCAGRILPGAGSAQRVSEQHEAAAGAVIESDVLAKIIPCFIRINNAKDGFNVIDRTTGHTVQSFEDMFDACAEAYLRVLQSLQADERQRRYTLRDK